MLCYKDRTFCASEVEEHTCGRVLTKEESEHAIKINLPVSYAKFCEPLKEQDEAD